MKVSQKLNYALAALLDLARQADQRDAVRTAEIASRQRLPERFLEGILAELRRAGLVLSQRGPTGGHRLARPAAAIRIGDVWRAVEGDLSVSPGPLAVGEEPDPFQRIWQAVDAAVLDIVDGTTLQDVEDWQASARGAADYAI